MVFFQPRFPTPVLRKLEIRMRHLLAGHLDGARRGSPWENPGDLCGVMPTLLQFARDFHETYSRWQREAAKQFSEPVRCTRGCSNCCQHYPMSIEPFEALLLYSEIRNRPDFARILEDCFRRVQSFAAFSREAEGLGDEDREDAALHRYFGQGLRCPLLGAEGECSVHLVRPITCRMYFSFTDPRYCTPEYLLMPENRSFHLCLPDSIEEDFGEWKERFSTLNLSESLYESLLQLNSWEQEGVFG